LYMLRNAICVVWNCWLTHFRWLIFKDWSVAYRQHTGSMHLSLSVYLFPCFCFCFIFKSLFIHFSVVSVVCLRGALDWRSTLSCPYATKLDFQLAVIIEKKKKKKSQHCFHIRIYLLCFFFFRGEPGLFRSEDCRFVSMS
jgi:hypothetical protein